MEAALNLTTADLETAAAICVNVAFLAPKFYDSRTLDVIYAFTDFYIQNPNATDQQVLDFTGGSYSNLRFLQGFVGGADAIRDSIYWVATIAEALPSTPGTGSMLVPVFWVFTVLTTTVLGLRLWSRQSIAGGIRAYDWIMVFGFIMTLIFGSTALYHAVNLNTTAQFWDYSWNQISTQQAFYMTLDVLYPVTALIIKSSLLLFYYNLSPARYLKWSVWATFVFTTLTAIASMSYSLFRCKPVAYWSEWYTSYCDPNPKIPYLVTGSLMILSDVIIWLMPLPMVMSLQLYRRERIAAVFTFSLGIFACIASAFRLDALNKYFLTEGGSGKTPIINTWTVVELNLAIICASAPALRALCIKHVPKLLSYGSNSTSNDVRSINRNESNGKVRGRIVVHHDHHVRSDAVSVDSSPEKPTTRIYSPV